MFDIKQFLMAVEQLAAEKNIPKNRIQETVEFAIAAAYKKENDLQGCKVKATLDPGTGTSKIWQELTVVDEKILEEEEKKFNAKKQIMLKDAKKKKKSAKVGDVIKISLSKNKDNYGRIATQTAKQVIIQKIKEVERDLTFSEYKEKEGEAISGIVQRQEKGTVFLDIGRTNGILPLQEQIPNENYNPGQRLRVLLLSVREESRGPVIFLSRRRVEFLLKLLALEVPEITNNDVEIKSIAREAGKRSKVAVTSQEEGIDPIGACVGQQGTRVSAVINELNGENIDIVLWSDNLNKFISNALSPAKVLDVKLNKENKEATVIVASDQLSLAIGKEGQNVRLAAKLTGWKIDVTANEKQEKETKEKPKAKEVEKKPKKEVKKKVKKEIKKNKKSS